jgi:Mg2+/Co2+ transporter CorB
MDNLPIGPLLGVVALLMLWSGLLTAVETAHTRSLRARDDSDVDQRSSLLAFEPASLILANTLIKVLISVITTLIALNYQLSGTELFGAWPLNGPTLAWLSTAALMLVFVELIPRRLAASHPAAMIYLANTLLRLPMKLLWPIAWLFDSLARVLLTPFAGRESKPSEPQKHSRQLHHDGVSEQHPARSPVLTGIRALDSITVNDILVPRSEVDGVNLDDSIELIIERLTLSRHTRLPVYHNDINQVQGVLNTRQVSHLLPKAELTKEDVLAACYEPYFIPESTPLQMQLLNFHKEQRRLGVVVDEYGEVLGIVSLEDILEEIVGEFENEQALDNPHIHPQPDGRLIVEGAASIRDLNKSLGWHLPSDGPKTLNGLVTEALETIPDSAVCLKIGPYRLEILETEDNRVTQVLMWQRPASR